MALVTERRRVGKKPRASGKNLGGYRDDPLLSATMRELDRLGRARRDARGPVTVAMEMQHLRSSAVGASLLTPLVRALPAHWALLCTYWALSREVHVRLGRWRPGDDEWAALRHPDPHKNRFLEWFPTVHMGNFEAKLEALRGLIIGVPRYRQTLELVVIPSVVAARDPVHFRSTFHGRHEPIPLRHHPPMYRAVQAWVGMLIEGRENGDMADRSDLYRTDGGQTIILRR